MGTKEVREGIVDISNHAYSVDFVMLNNVIQTIADVIGLILGIIAFAIVMLMTLITAIDVCYITIPMFREQARIKNWDGGNKYGLSAISKDAYNSVVEAFTEGPSSNAYILKKYLGKRIISYAIAIGVLFIVVGGMDYIRDIVENIVRAIVMVIIR